MKYITEGLFPTLVFKNFECISRIPRPSGHEGAISDYIMNFAKSLGLETYQDSYKNLIVKKPAILTHPRLCYRPMWTWYPKLVTQ